MPRSTVLVGMIVPAPGTPSVCRISLSTMSASAAMAICSAIASGMIALTGIVFSLAFVMVQFSATAYSPRLVLWVARDPVVSHALGDVHFHLSLRADVARVGGPQRVGQGPLDQRSDGACVAPGQHGNVRRPDRAGGLAAGQPHAGFHRRSGTKGDRRSLPAHRIGSGQGCADSATPICRVPRPCSTPAVPRSSRPSTWTPS